MTLFKNLFYYVLSVSYTHSFLCSAVEPIKPAKDQAVVIEPFVDASGESKLYTSDKNINYIFSHFPFAPDKGIFCYSRIHQLKCNEIVTIEEELSDSLTLATARNYFFDDGKEYKSSFLIPNKALVPLKTLSKYVDCRNFPPPIDRDTSPAVYNKNVLTLVWPWTDKKTQKIYSVGTRFKRCKEKDTQNSYAFYLLDTIFDKALSCRFRISHVPKGDALVQYPAKADKMLELFLKIIRRWIYDSNGIVPYVFGGATFTKPLVDKGAYIKRGFQCGYGISYWLRWGAHEPYSGFDCSSLLMAAAQICGMPYYFKNTSTLCKHMKSLPAGTLLETGDLIWYKGHVILISDATKNLLIESVGYDSGYGRLHEISLAAIFPTIKDYKALSKLLNQELTLYRYHKKGYPYKPISKLRAFRLKDML